MDGEKTILESALERGISRRRFLQMCTGLAATMGLSFSQTDVVVKAMETKKRVPVIWLQMQDCTGCSESFIRSTHPKVESVLLEMISLEYSEVLSAASGHHIETARQSVLENYNGEYVLVVEGSIPLNDDFLMIGGRSAKELLLETAKGAMAVITYGSCSSWGGIAAAKPNPTHAVPVTDLIKDKPVIRIPGCPPIAEVMTGVIAHIITFGTIPELDSQKRPKAFYRHRIHDTCNRRAYFDAGLFAESFDDEGAKQGYCLYKLGCKGPTTYSSCAQIRWNGGVSFPIQSGNPCIGCTENQFWDNGPFYVREAEIPGTQTTINPEKVGLYATGAALAGIAVHASITAMKKEPKKQENSINRGE
ncbi:hydrogenase small subunit [Tepidibacillus decaturensis]|uniref:[NiFe] hydrogenase small subunit HydA n=1 Tax=Tepidibacillus decaturensis TaxID=1413211 RepID=A0A135L6B9_9BACI|nr:hydrogenase small subunit [Tepidibacillus decaturensis]KXG44447.1 [NiFe] hydrogenase small subunit HydA [Tepidibacillus decaturensis]